MSILELVGLGKQFGALVALDDVNLAIEEGEILGLIGPNGAGKTTLFNVVTGFLPATRGKVVWKGEDITNLPPHAIAKRGIVRTFQHGALCENMAVLKNVIIAHHLHTGTGVFQQFLRTPGSRKTEKAIEDNAMKLLSFVDLASQEHKLAGELSSGYRKVLTVAIAYAAKPELLLLDEPVTTLSPDRVEKMMRLIVELRNAGSTIVIIEHNTKAIMDYCDRVVALAYGKKIAEGTAREVRENKAVIEAYLGVMG